MTDLPIHITTHHLRLSDPLRLIVRGKLAPVARFANDAIAAEIVLRRRNGAQTRFSASARVALPGQDVHGHAVHVNLYVAIGKLAEKLGRLLRKRKTRLAKAFKSEKRRRPHENYRLDRNSPRHHRLLPANTASAD
jgi:ribosomal subunit interface protein